MIPDFDLSGVLPPYVGPDPTDSASMSPYGASIIEVVEKFSTSPERQAILSGLLRYRDALSKVGITDAFQWLNGSFFENIESIEGRPPRDIDVVSFLHRPVMAKADADWVSFLGQNLPLFDPKQAKSNYLCDTYFVDLGLPAENVVAYTRYWFGLLSHRRVTQQWKGIVQVPLCNGDDVIAFTRLISSGAP